MSSIEVLLRIDSLKAQLDLLGAIEASTGASMFMGRPDRWWDDAHWRCVNDHVSTRLLKSEALRARVCLACHGPVQLTFPEDRDGTFELPTTCPYCGRQNDLETPLHSRAGHPEPGSLAICWLCHRVGVFTDQLQLRKPTPEEEAEIAADPSVAAALGAVAFAPTPAHAAILASRIEKDQ